jgi:creatinine amidohydrolase/Fe(II)-dependent formamide hydrolase-like protein
MHAGAADTSLALAVDEQLVRGARLHDGSALTAAEGVSGDPRRASAAAGRAGLDLIVARTRDAIQREVARH